MKRRIRITEGQLYRLIKRTLNEGIDRETMKLAKSLKGKHVYTPNVGLETITRVSTEMGKEGDAFVFWGSHSFGPVMELNDAELHELVEYGEIDDIKLLNDEDDYEVQEYFLGVPLRKKIIGNRVNKNNPNESVAHRVMEGIKRNLNEATSKRQKQAVNFCEYMLDVPFEGDINNWREVREYLNQCLVYAYEMGIEKYKEKIAEIRKYTEEHPDYY